MKYSLIQQFLYSKLQFLILDRHVKLQKSSSCLQLGNLKISIAGMVSALKRHHAYENVHIWGYTVGMLVPVFRHHAYKIERIYRHGDHFSAPSCLHSPYFPANTSSGQCWRPLMLPHPQYIIRQRFFRPMPATAHAASSVRYNPPKMSCARPSMSSAASISVQTP